MSALNMWAYKHPEKERAWVAVGYFSTREQALEECAKRGITSSLSEENLKPMTDNEKFAK